MNQDTVIKLTELSAEVREHHARNLPDRMSVSADLAGIALRSLTESDQDLNYTSPVDLALALQKNECSLSVSAKNSTVIAISGKADPNRIDSLAEEVTDYMFDTGFDDLRPDQQFVSLMQVMYAIDNVKVAKFGIESSTVMSNHFSYQVAGRLLECMATDDDSMVVYESVVATLELLRADKPYYDWFFAKADRFIRLLHIIKNFNQQAETLGPRYAAKEISEGIVQDVTDVFNLALEKRTYGVKQCYVNALDGGSWVFDDPYVISNSILEESTIDEMTRRGLPQSLMIALKTPEKELETPTINTVAVKLSNGAMIERSQVGFDLTGGVHLGPDGELYIDSDLVLPLRTIFEGAGAQNAYEVLRAELIGHFADLVMPAIIIMGKKLEQVNLTVNENSSAEDVINDLILPRKKYLLSSIEDIESAENNEDEQTQGKSIREHGVVYHQRRLLPNQKPSPEALLRAERHNVMLEPGKTFVKSHKRGNGPGKVIGHRKITS